MNIELGEYVGELLYENDCVIIPDFGGILANYKPASIHPKQDLFKPPTKQLSFNIKLKANDGLLVNHIAQVNSVGYQEALEIVTKGVKAYQLKLDTDGSVHIVSVGKVYKDKDGNLNFEADAFENFLPSAFGLSGFSSPSIKRDGASLKVEKHTEPKVEKKVRFISKKLLAAAVAVPILLASAAIFFKTDIEDSMDMNFSSMDPKAFLERSYHPRKNDPIKVIEVKSEEDFVAKNKNTIVPLYLNADSIPLVVNLMEEKEVEKTEITNKETLNEVKVVLQSGGYYIIGGAFAKKRNANKLVKALIKDGYDASIVGRNTSGLFRVAYGIFPDRKVAKSNLQVIQISRNKNAWLLKS